MGGPEMPFGPGSDADLRAQIEELRRRVQQNDDEIDAMQIAASQGRSLPFYRQPALMIAMLSLLLAFGTTVLSTIRVDQDQKHASRTELTGYIQRLADIPRQQAEIYQQHPNGDAGDLIAELNAEQQSVAHQARAVIRSIPDEVTPVEYMAVGYAFQSLGDLDSADDLYQEGYLHAQTSQDKIFGLRSLAGVRFQRADYDTGRSLLEQALTVHDSDRQASAAIIASDNAQTQLFWANAELGARHCPEASSHADAAQQLIAAQSLTNLAGALQQLSNGIAACVPVVLPSPAGSPAA